MLLIVNSKGMSVSLAAYIKGFMEYKKWALEGVEFADIVKVNENIYWGGIKY